MPGREGEKSAKKWRMRSCKVGEIRTSVRCVGDNWTGDLLKLDVLFLIKSFNSFKSYHQNIEKISCIAISLDVLFLIKSFIIASKATNKIFKKYRVLLFRTWKINTRFKSLPQNIETFFRIFHYYSMYSSIR